VVGFFGLAALGAKDKRDDLAAPVAVAVGAKVCRLAAAGVVAAFDGTVDARLSGTVLVLGRDTLLDSPMLEGLGFEAGAGGLPFAFGSGCAKTSKSAVAL